MKPTAEALEVCSAEMARVLPIARERYSYLHVPPVKWDLRGYSTAGLAYSTFGVPEAGFIRLNGTLANAEGAAFARAVGHEVAHLVACAYWGRAGSGHGSGWANVMRAFGLPADARSSYKAAGEMAAAANVRRGGARAQCSGCGWVGAITPRLLAKMNASRAKVSCPKCHTPIAADS